MTLLALMVTSMLFATSVQTPTVNAQTTSTDLLQYEFKAGNAGPDFTRLTCGPAPNSPDILSSKNITGLQSYPCAFNGNLYVRYANTPGADYYSWIKGPKNVGLLNTTINSGVLALDPNTGAVVWNTSLAGGFDVGTQGNGVWKIDDHKMIAGKYLINTDNGAIIWTATNGFNPTQSWGSGQIYVAELKMFFCGQRAWSLADLSQQPVLAWDNTGKFGDNIGGGNIYGQGLIFGGCSQGHYAAINATTGKIVWDTQTMGEMSYGATYVDGRVIRGGTTDNTVYCFNASTGVIMWTYHPNTWYGSWASGSASAYGMWYEENNDNYLYAINITDGSLVWRYLTKGILYQGYQVIGDGKIYAQTGESSAIDRQSGVRYCEPEYSAIDAYTGKQIWSIPMMCGDPVSTHCIAFGNLYLMPLTREAGYGQNYGSTGGALGGPGYYFMGRPFGMTQDILVCIGSPKPYSNFRADPSGSQTATGVSGPANLNLLWQFETKGMVVASPVAADGKIFVGSQDKTFYALDSWKGNVIWSYKTGAMIRGSAAVANGKVYVQPDDQYLYCFNANTGSLLWKKDTGASTVAFDALGSPIFAGNTACVRASPIVYNGYVYVGSLANKTYCFDANTGDQKWTFNTEGQIASTPIVYNNALYVTCRGNGSIYKLDLLSGSMIRRYQVPGTGGVNASATNLNNASPTIYNGVIYYPAQTGYCYAISEATGSTLWRYMWTEYATVNTYSMLFMPPNKVVYIDRFEVRALDVNTGYVTTDPLDHAGNPKILWDTYVGREVSSSPTYAPGLGQGDGKVYLATDSGQIYSLNSTDGTKLGYYIGNDLACGWSSAAVYEGHMYIGNSNWKVYAFADQPIQTLPLTVISSGTYVKTNAPLTISGQMLPPVVPNINLTVTIGFGSVYTNFPVKTDSSGKFSITYTPKADGLYSYLVYTEGYKYYGASYSDTHYFAASSPAASVQDPSSPVSSSISLSADQGSSAAQPVSASPANNVFSIEYVCALIAVAVIAITAAALVMKKKPKK
jgi:outer membrane protein assembly factor BamB